MLPTIPGAMKLLPNLMRQTIYPFWSPHIKDGSVHQFMESAAKRYITICHYMDTCIAPELLDDTVAGRFRELFLSHACNVFRRHNSQWVPWTSPAYPDQDLQPTNAKLWAHGHADQAYTDSDKKDFEAATGVMFSTGESVLSWSYRYDEIRALENTLSTTVKTVLKIANNYGAGRFNVPYRNLSSAQRQQFYPQGTPTSVGPDAMHTVVDPAVSAAIDGMIDVGRRLSLRHHMY